VIAQPLRVALTGKTVSPGIDEIMVTLGRNGLFKGLTPRLPILKLRINRAVQGRGLLQNAHTLKGTMVCGVYPGEGRGCA